MIRLALLRPRHLRRMTIHSVLRPRLQRRQRLMTRLAPRRPLNPRRRTMIRSVQRRQSLPLSQPQLKRLRRMLPIR